MRRARLTRSLAPHKMMLTTNKQQSTDEDNPGNYSDLREATLYPRQAGSQTTKAWVILSPVLMLLHVCIILLSPALEALSPAADNSGITR